MTVHRVPLMTIIFFYLLVSRSAAATQQDPRVDALYDEFAVALTDDSAAVQVAFQERIAGLEGQGNPLSDVDLWAALLERRRQEALERVWGTGRVIEDQIEHQEKGEMIIFEYAYRLPRNYDSDVSWPVVLCLPEKGESGEDYLDDYWEDNAAMKKIADRFILVAPNSIEKTPRRRIGRRQYSKELRVERLDRHHAMSLVLPLMEILDRVNGSIDRIFVEGRGEGAGLALDLAALYGVELFCGVSAAPSTETAAGISGGLDGVFRHAMQVGDEVEAEAALLDRVAFYDKHQRVGIPDQIHLVTNNPIFRMRAWLKVTTHMIGDGVVADIQAELDREKNRVLVSASGVHGFTIFLNDNILDLDRPIEVEFNGKVIAKQSVERSTEYLMRQLSFARPGETQRIYTACLPVDVPVEMQESLTTTEDSDE